MIKKKELEQIEGIENIPTECTFPAIQIKNAPSPIFSA